MPTSASLSFSQARLQPGASPEHAVPGNVPMVSGTYAKGQLLGRLTSGGKFTTYNSAQSDGSQVARVIAQYDMTVDSSGNVTIGANTEWSQTLPTAPVYFSGYFLCEDIPNLTSGAVSDLGRLIYGTTSSGLLRAS